MFHSIMHMNVCVCFDVSRSFAVLPHYPDGRGNAVRLYHLKLSSACQKTLVLRIITAVKKCQKTDHLSLNSLQTSFSGFHFT